MQCVFSKTGTRRTGKIKLTPFLVYKIVPYVITLNHNVIFNVCCQLHCFLVINTQSIFTQTHYVGDLSIGDQDFEVVFDTSSYNLVVASDSCISQGCRKLHFRPSNVTAYVSAGFLSAEPLVDSNPTLPRSLPLYVVAHMMIEPSMSSSRVLSLLRLHPRSLPLYVVAHMMIEPSMSSSRGLSLLRLHCQQSKASFITSKEMYFLLDRLLPVYYGTFQTCFLNCLELMSYEMYG